MLFSTASLQDSVECNTGVDHAQCIPAILCLPAVAAVLSAASTKHLRSQNADFGQLTSLSLGESAVGCCSTSGERVGHFLSSEVCRSLQDKLFELTESGGETFVHVCSAAKDK